MATYLYIQQRPPPGVLVRSGLTPQTPRTPQTNRHRQTMGDVKHLGHAKEGEEGFLLLIAVGRSEGTGVALRGPWGANR